jgi:hypothetical protein
VDDDALQALWTVFDQTGIRPEYLLPVLYFESGFNPAVPNAAGAPFYGIAQTSGAKLASLGVTPAAFLAMSAGDQIRTAVLPYFAGVVQRYGAIKSATRAEQANFEPATLAYIRSLAQILEPRGTRAYADNARAFDPASHGAITLADLALAMSHAAAAPATKAAIARAYVLRPSAGPACSPVYGEDFVDPAWTLGALALGLAAALR